MVPSWQLKLSAYTPQQLKRTLSIQPAGAMHCSLDFCLHETTEEAIETHSVWESNWPPVWSPSGGPAFLERASVAAIRPAFQSHRYEIGYHEY